MPRYTYRRQTTNGVAAFGAIILMFAIFFLVASFSAWLLMIGLGNAYAIGLVSVAPGFWDTLSVSIWATAFISVASGAASRVNSNS